jgi:epoxyqueuosine reductase
MERCTVDLGTLAADIKRWGEEEGFQQVGITDTDLSAYRDKVRAWLAAGRHGEMGYMARHLEQRLHPELLEPGTCRVIAARMNYLPGGADPLSILDDPQRAVQSLIEFSIILFNLLSLLGLFSLLINIFLKSFSNR